MKHSSRETRRQLLAIAVEQGGYFTAKQARDAGYDYPHLDYHVSCGNFIRVGHGLYRLPHLPPAEHDDLIRLSAVEPKPPGRTAGGGLPRFRAGLHELSELLPTTTHLTVPPGFRKRALEGCVLHKALLPLSDIEERQGFRVTTPLRTLLDVARDSISQEQLLKAVAAALTRGMVCQNRLEAAIGADSQSAAPRVCSPSCGNTGLLT